MCAQTSLQNDSFEYLKEPDESLKDVIHNNSIELDSKGLQSTSTKARERKNLD